MNKKTKIILAVVALSTSFLSANSSVVEFGYTGENGPTHWGELSDDWKTCENGNYFTKVEKGSPHQSPIDFTKRAHRVEMSNIEDLNFSDNGNFEVINNGHTIEMIPDNKEDYTAVINGQEYKLLQFHLHGSSEHTEKEKHSEMEMHMVMQNSEGKYAVLGFFIDPKNNQKVNKPGRELHKIFEGHKLPEGETVEEGSYVVNLDLSSFISAFKHSKVYEYQGSFTTPPCTEGVQWEVFKKHIKIPREDVQKFQEYYNFNYRPVTGWM